MEALQLVLNDGRLFDKLVHGGVKQASSITIATKSCGTEGGKAVAVVAFDVELEGKLVHVQATTTARLLVTAGRGIAAAHPETEI